LLDLVGVLGTPAEMDTCACLHVVECMRVLADDGEALAGFGVDEVADERADEHDVGDRRGLSVPVDRDPFGPDADPLAVALEDVRRSDEARDEPVVGRS
jgi:hypothetical protein